MLDALDITEEEAAGLSELAAIDLATARRFAERAQATEDADVANRLARTSQRAARSYRQTLALKVRLRRALSEHARDYPPEPAETRAARHVAEVRRAVSRVAWAEREALEGPEEEREDFFDDLMFAFCERLEACVGTETFERLPVDDAVVRICLDLDLPEAAARAWRDLPVRTADAVRHWQGPGPDPP
ncbi:MAG: hypothetical protein KKE02_04310 [Alphaproteobacteria bacterium]|nr:hypothetical protein [Alphaproteobacteria bacterium]MBU1513646.1 hypothetical protein [Alphaproteobacteria bacterium]MBU2094709.1 hypothetical protein [Alphaproteobacteria bacterium]MBU2150222.1 hypothetical protein [Alphaproteobacteria bacterium]MBU2309249.1 hypothetical protein [Alphaproteobacteria bacterium]